MVYYKMTDYNLLGFDRARNKRKKYEAKLQNKKTGEIYAVPFGQMGYEQYRDKIGYYKTLDHLDDKRRENFLKRNAHNIREGYYSPGYLSAFYLW